MKKIKEKFKSVRFRLFFVLCSVIIFLVLCLIIINSAVLKSFYLYSKTNTIKKVYTKINNYYEEPSLDVNLENELRKIAYMNNFDILIKTDRDLIVFSTNKDFLNSLDKITETPKNSDNIIYKDDNMKIRKIEDGSSILNYILLTGKLVNGNDLFIRIPIAPIDESVRISNNVLILIGITTLFIASFAISFVSRKFTEPILQLNNITNKVANLDFTQKYRITDSDDEINELGKNINTMSDKLENTIKKLKDTNRDLEKDIEEKSKIDEMRKQFISDVSHELKTPIALIQGYAEGLVENVNDDEESRKFYAEVILDESNKMDRLVKELLELMKIEYGKREFNDKKFNIIELINEVVRKCNVVIKEKNIKVEINNKEPIYVFADDFYIEQIVTNYFTNAMKHVKEINEIKEININTEIINAMKVRVSIYNSGNKIDEGEIDRIWGRFYKVDSSRNRNDGGSGIGLSLVKAIQNNYKNDYGVKNKENGVEFYFDINLAN